MDIEVVGAGSLFPSERPELLAMPTEFGGRSYPAHACPPAPGKEFIAAGKLRRMGRAQQLALGSACLATNGRVPPDAASRGAVCLGTGLGETGSTAAFLKSVLDPDQPFPKPTHFINSVHNALASEIAMALDFKGENSTFTHGAVSFELALSRALQVLRARRSDCVLACGADELTPYAVEFGQRYGWWRTSLEPLAPLESAADKAGTLPGEGAGALMLARPGTVDAEPLARIRLCRARPIAQPVDPRREKDFIAAALGGIGVQLNDIQLLILGANGDSALDAVYAGVVEELRACVSEEPCVGVYKHACGEFCSAAALGVGLAVEAARSGAAPARLRCLGNWAVPKNVLVYHVSLTGYHSVCLVAS